MKAHFLKILFLLYLCIRIQHIYGKDFFWENISPGFDALMERMETCMRSEKDSFCVDNTIKEMYHLARKSDKKQMLARAIYWEVRKGKMRSLDSTFIFIENAISLTDSARYPYDRARMDMQKAAALLKSAQYLDAYRLYSSAANVFHDVGDLCSEAFALNYIGYIFFFLNEYDNAVTLLMRSDSIFTHLKLDKEAIECKLLLANIYNKTDKKKQARSLLKPIVDNRKLNVSAIVKISVLSAYLDCLENEKEVQRYSGEAYALAKKINDPYYLLITTLNKGWSMFYTGCNDSAYIYAQLADSCVSVYHTPYGMQEGVYKLFTSVYAERAQWDSAFYYQNLYYACQDSVRGKEVLSDIHRMEIRTQIEKYQIQSILEKQKNHQRLLFFLIISIALLAMLLLSAYIIYLLRKRMQREQQKQIEKEREQNALLSIKIEQIENQNRELSSSSILIMKKNDTLKNVLKEMEIIWEKKLPVSKELLQKIRMELHTDETWESFKLHFDQVHPSFFSNLKQKYPKLTDNDLRLCAYIRIGLSNKQIAEMLLVQSKAIFQARYRLKKKIGLADEDNISDYLKSVST